jgi:uncharacterized protein YegL
MSTQEIVAIIDRSGSMRGKEELTINGINTTIDELKTSDNANKINMSIKFFNDAEELKIRSVNILSIGQLNPNDLKPSGTTALLDAIGNTISYFIEKKIRDENAYENCLIYVATDGLENSSKSFNSDRLKKIIKNGENNYNIKIMYLGANQDAILEASKIGIAPERSINYNESRRATENVYTAVARSATRSLAGYDTQFTQSERHESSVTY